MTEPPRQRRFQIHLSTAIAMMFVAGGLLALNMRWQKVPFVTFNQKMIDEINDFDQRAFASISSKTTRLNVVWDERHSVTSMGWPCRAVIFNDFAYMVAERPDWSVVERPWRVHYGALAINLTLMLAVLLAAAFLCEWLIRRHAARKGA